MLAGMYMGYVIIRAIMDPSVAPKLPPEQRNVSTATVLASLAVNFFPLFLLIAFVLGAIIRGLATPSEAAAVGSAGALVLAFAYRLIGANGFGFKQVKESTFLTARASAMVCWLFRGLRRVLGGLRLSRRAEGGRGFRPVAQPQRLLLLILTQAIIFVLGWPLEWTEIIVIFLPIFLPLLDDFGVDPIFFGVLVALNLQTSFLSPPVAMCALLPEGRGAQACYDR